MRQTALLLTLFAGACASDEGELQYTSTLEAQTRGVVLSYDGLDAYAAMGDTTCKVDTTWGCPTADGDLPTDDEWVIDHFEGRTLAASDLGVHMLDGSQVWLEDADLAVDQVRDARITSKGLVVLAGDENGCSMANEDGSVALPGEFCLPNLSAAVDRTEGALLVATSDGLFRVDGSGVHPLPGSGDLVAVGHDGVFYTATRGATGLTAFDPAGTTLWTAETAGPVVSIAARGDTGDLLALVRDGGLGALERHDGASGETAASYALPAAEGDLVTSGNGRTVGIVLPDAVHYYSLDLPGEAPVIDETPATDCMVDTPWAWSAPNFGD
jgi:hypothetical protein